MIDRVWTSVRSPAFILDYGPVVGLLLLSAVLLRDERAAELAATFLLVVLPLVRRRSWPLAVLVVITAGVVVTQASASWVDIAAVALASFTVADLADDRALSALAVVLVGFVSAGLILSMGGDPGPSLTVPFVVLVPPWLLGDAVRSQRLEARARREAAERDERDAIERLVATAAEERRHVARELHDVVAHSVSVMLIQAGAARQVVRTSPDRAEESLLSIEATGREAMEEMRHLLRVLSDEGESGGTAPQPGIAQLEPLIERVRHAGLPATLEIDGTIRALPASVDMAVYRIVQEALTNALRYAQKAATLVRVTYGTEDLRVEVLDSGPAAELSAGDGSGRGLVGMRERANLVGGRLEAGPRIGGGYAVRAWLPVEVPGQ